MKQPRTKLAQLIADTTLRKGRSKSLSEEVAAYLLSEHRTSELESVLRDVQADWANAGFVEVLAYSAFPLTAEVKKDITSELIRIYPEAKKFHITEMRDPDVIGGVRLKLSNQQLDLSIEAKLDKFKQLTAAGKDI